jgi:hypothetical protein
VPGEALNDNAADRAPIEAGDEQDRQTKIVPSCGSGLQLTASWHQRAERLIHQQPLAPARRAMARVAAYCGELIG